MKQRIEELRNANHSLEKIADILSIDVSTVRYHLNPKRKQSQIDRVSRYRRNIKQKALDYSGGKCLKCCYDTCNDALTFHHLDPTQKEIGIGKGNIKSWERIKEEIDKCILLCCRCHAELHAGLWEPNEDMIKLQNNIRSQFGS